MFGSRQSTRASCAGSVLTPALIPNGRPRPDHRPFARTLPAAERSRWRNLVAQDINDRGWMTGFGALAGGDGSLRGFVLKPR